MPVNDLSIEANFDIRYSEAIQVNIVKINTTIFYSEASNPNLRPFAHCSFAVERNHPEPV